MNTYCCMETGRACDDAATIETVTVPVHEWAEWREYRDGWKAAYDTLRLAYGALLARQVPS